MLRYTKRTLIIARYDEPLWWFSMLDRNVDVFLYNKGKDDLNFDLPDYVKIQKLENVGNDVHTFNYHILKHYDHLENQGLLIFVQGGVNGHDPLCVKNINKLSGLERFGHLGFPWIRRQPHLDQIVMWSKLFSTPMPDQLISPVGGMWYSQGSEIKKRLPEFYQKIMDISLDDPPYDGMAEERPMVFSGIHEGLLPLIYGGYTYEEWCQVLRDEIGAIPFPQGHKIPRQCL